jgi:hypothetical protein
MREEEVHPPGGAALRGGISGPAAALPLDTETDLSRLVAASAGLARLDEALRRSSDAVRAGWQARALIDEAAASARLDDTLVAAEDLLLFDVDALDRVADPELGGAHRTLGLLRAASRRSPRHLFTPKRLMALARLRLRSEPVPAAPTGLPPWLAGRLAKPEDIRHTLGRVLSRERVSAWRRQPALLAAADLLARWHDTGAADGIGAAAGRVLAAAWPARCGLTHGLVLMPADGFRGHAGTYRPGCGPGWPGAFLAAAERAAAAGLARLGALTALEQRLAVVAAGHRTNSRLAALGRLLLARPAVGTRDAVTDLGLSPDGARRLIDTLVDTGLVRELSGRGSFRVFALR